MIANPAVQNAMPVRDDTDAGDIDLREIVGVLLGQWPLILGIALFTLAASLFYLFVKAPVYQTDAFIQVEQNQNSAGVAFQQLTELMSAAVPVTAEVEILRSRFVVGRVVANLGLDIEALPIRMPLLGDAYARRYGGSGFAPVPMGLALFNQNGYSWGGERIVVTTLAVPDELLDQPLRLVKRADNQYVVLDVLGQQLLQGSVGQQVKAELPSGLLAIYVQELHAADGTAFKLRKRRRDDVIGWIQENLTVTASKMAEGVVNLSYEGTDPRQISRVLTEVLNVYQTQNLDRRSAEAEQTLAFLTQQLPELKKEVETAEAKLNQFKVEKGTADLTQETAAVLQRSVELEQKRAELLQQRTQSLQRFTANHPVIETLNAQIAQIDGQIGRVSGRVKQLPDIEQKALQLSRDVQVSTALYISLLNRTQELEVVKSGTVGSIRIIDLPITPVLASKPKPPLVMALGCVLGLMLGVLAAFTFNALRNGVDDPVQVERKLGLPTYGAIPYSSVQSKLARLFKQKSSSQTTQLLALAEPTGVAMEAIRSVRTALHFAQMDAANNILMLTGPEPSLGKSFVSINLGATLADTGKRVLVIDADMRRGHIHKMVGQQRELGLSEVISGSASLSECIKTTVIPNLCVMTTGVLPPNPSELLVNERFVELLNGLSSQFDHVIIDTPPALAVTDAAIIGRHSGICLLVLKAGEHPMRMIEETLNRLLRAGVQVRGTLFNQVGKGRAGRYGYKYGYSYSGYQYAYKSAQKA